MTAIRYRQAGLADVPRLVHLPRAVRGASAPTFGTIARVPSTGDTAPVELDRHWMVWDDIEVVKR